MVHPQDRKLFVKVKGNCLSDQNILTKNNLREKGFIWLTMMDYIRDSSSRKLAGRFASVLRKQSVTRKEGQAGKLQGWPPVIFFI